MAAPTLPELVVALVTGHASAVYWFTIIKIIYALYALGLPDAAEWVSRVTGLRARLEALLEDPGDPRP